MTKVEVEYAVREWVSNDNPERPVRIAWHNKRKFEVSPGYGMYACMQFDFDSLCALSKMLGTTNISFDGNKGWAGTEVTPGDPADMRLVITLTQDVD